MNINTRTQYTRFNKILFRNSAKDGFKNKLLIFFHSNKLYDDLMLINKQLPKIMIIIVLAILLFFSRNKNTNIRIIASIFK
jgi:hypothetical protein